MSKNRKLLLPLPDEPRDLALRVDRHGQLKVEGPVSTSERDLALYEFCLKMIGEKVALTKVERITGIARETLNRWRDEWLQEQQRGKLLKPRQQIEHSHGPQVKCTRNCMAWKPTLSSS
jgi:hypothetical protein